MSRPIPTRKLFSEFLAEQPSLDLNPFATDETPEERDARLEANQFREDVYVYGRREAMRRLANRRGDTGPRPPRDWRGAILLGGYIFGFVLLVAVANAYS